MQNSSQLEDEPIKQDTDVCIPLNLSVPNSSGQSDHSSPDLYLWFQQTKCEVRRMVYNNTVYIHSVLFTNTHVHYRGSIP